MRVLQCNRQIYQSEFSSLPPFYFQFDRLSPSSPFATNGVEENKEEDGIERERKGRFRRLLHHRTTKMKYHDIYRCRSVYVCLHRKEVVKWHHRCCIALLFILLHHPTMDSSSRTPKATMHEAACPFPPNSISASLYVITCPHGFLPFLVVRSLILQSSIPIHVRE